MKRTLTNLTALFIALVSVILIPVLPVWAQAPETSVIRLDTLIAPWLEILIGVAVSVFVAIGGFVTVWIKQRTGMQIEFFHRDTFQTALNNAAGWVKMQAGNVQLDVKSPAIREAIIMVNNGAKDAVNHFGITPDEIAKRIIAKIGIQETSVVIDQVRPNPGADVYGTGNS